MSKFSIFIIRVTLGVVFAVLLTDFFLPHANPVYIAGLVIFLVGMAYFLECLRGRKTGQ